METPDRAGDGDEARSHAGGMASTAMRTRETATVTGELLGTSNAQIRRNLTGAQPRLFEPWLALSDEPAPAE